jgi:SAM-dependent methyltransferase
MTNKFDKVYFEDGVRNHISAYENYKWMPERSIQEAIAITNIIKFNTVLDYGCAKGFLVYALQLLGKKSFGVDISNYALDNCHEKVKDKLFHINNLKSDFKYDLVISKDVLEHISYDDIDTTLQFINSISNNFLLIIPLGENGKYRIREYEMDTTHIIREPEEWWLNKLVDAGFKIKTFNYAIAGLKDHWVKVNQYGNAFIVCE